MGVHPGVLSPEDAEILEGRGLDIGWLAKLGVHSKPVGKAGGSCIAIPFIREGRAVHHKYFVYKSSFDREKTWQDKDSTKSFYNEDVLRDPALRGQPLIITEGEWDTMAALQSGFVRVMSVPDGAPGAIVTDPDSKKYSYLDEVMPLLSVDNVPVIILAVDDDPAGANLLHDLSVRLGKARCKWVRYPKLPPEVAEARGRERCKDLGDVLFHYGEKAVVETLERSISDPAMWLRVDGVYRMSELPPLPAPVVFDIGFPDLRDNFRMRLADLTIVTGIPSMGKSTWVNDLVCRVVNQYHVDACFASFEQNPQRDHKRNLRRWFGGNFPDRMTQSELYAADAWIDDHFHFLVPNEDEDVDLEWLLEKMAVAAIQRACKVFVVDPWNEMDHARERDETTTEYTGRAIKALRRFARKFQVHVIIVAHPTKVQKVDGKFRVPTLYDIADSAHWYNKSDVGVIVHREGDLSLIEVVKSRYHDDIGKPGGVEAIFKPNTGRFEVVGPILRAA